MVSFFFFQAEDGIRDTSVTGVQTCALPISLERSSQTAGATPRLPVAIEAKGERGLIIQHYPPNHPARRGRWRLHAARPLRDRCTFFARTSTRHLELQPQTPRRIAWPGLPAGSWAKKFPTRQRVSPHWQEETDTG